MIIFIDNINQKSKLATDRKQNVTNLETSVLPYMLVNVNLPVDVYASVFVRLKL